MALVRFVQADRSLLTLPVAWTSYREPDDFERVSAGRSLWRFDDLESLRSVVDSLRERAERDDQKSVRTVFIHLGMHLPLAIRAGPVDKFFVGRSWCL